MNYMPGLKSPSYNAFPNVKDSLFVKINGTIVKNQKHILQISVRELHNDMILPSSLGGSSSARTIDENICIGDTSLRKYMPKFIKIMSKKTISRVDAKPS